MSKWRMTVLVCALAVCLPATAWADDFVAGATGTWTTPGTWLVGGLVPADYPAAGDTAVITGGFTVTADAAIDPLITSVSIATGGTLELSPVQTTLTTLTAPWLMDGGTILITRDDGIIAGTVTVNSASTFDIQSVWNYEGSGINATIANGASTTGVLTKAGDGTLSLGANNSGFSGGWDILAGQLSTNVNGALGTGTTTIRSGARVRINPDTTVGPSLLVMEDNTRLILAGNYSAGAVQASGTVTIDASRNNTTNWLTSNISGSGALILTNSGGSTALGIGGDNSGYTGNIIITPLDYGKTLLVSHANALGTNTAGGLVTVKSGSNLSIGNLAATFERDVTFENGANLVTASGATRTVTGVLTLLSGQVSVINPRGNSQTSVLSLDGRITGAGQLIYTSSNDWPTGSDRRTTVSNAANNYAGGTIIDDSTRDYDSNATFRDGGRDNYVRVTNNGALSTGTVSVLAGALWTAPAGGSGSAVLNSVVGPITFQGGTFMLGSTETKQVTLAEAGALRVMAAVATLTYTPTSGQIQIYNNAILDKTSVVDVGLALPAASDIQGTAAQNQVLLGLRANYAAEGWFGPGAGGNGGGSGTQIWGGLGTTDWSFAITTGTIHEYTSGGGFTLAAQKARQININAGARLDATGPINLVGNGNFVIAGTPIVNQAGAINKSGSGLIQFTSTGGLPALKTLNLNGGYLDVNAVDAIAGTVEINATGCFRIDQNLTTGAINANAGGAVYFSSNAQVTGSATFTWDPNSQIILAGNNLAMPAGTPGVVDVILTTSVNDAYAGGIVLNNNTRLTHAINYVWSGNTADLQTGEVSSAGTQARLAAQQGYTLQIASKVNLPGKKLIVGDVNDFATFNRTGTTAGMLDQKGTVYLSNSTNQIGTIDIQAGTLHVNGTATGYADTAKLGGATEIRVASGATLSMHSDYASTWALSTVISGNGTVRPYYYKASTGLGGQSTLQITPAVGRDAALSPGDSAGTLNVNGHLSFGAPIINGTPLTLQQDTSSFSQGGAYTIATTTDANFATSNNGWAVSGRPNNDVAAAWEFTVGGEPAAGSDLLLVMSQLFTGEKHTVGKFSISYTTADRSTYCDGLDVGGNVGSGIWTVLTPSGMSATNGVALTNEGSGVIFATAPSGSNQSVYSLSFDSLPAGVTGIRIDALGDSRLGGGVGPGYSATGNLVLTELETLMPIPGQPLVKYAQYLLDVAGDNGVAGTDHDRVAVTGTANVANGQVVVSLAVPSANLKPTTPNWAQPGTPTEYVTRDLGDMTIVSAASVAGTFAGVIVDADPKLAGFQDSGPWVLKSGAAGVSYTATEAVLKGADIVWLGLPGDANLDNTTDVSDLSLLAGNFRKTTGMTWLQGDFNFDGAVDVSDLSLLAGRFRQTNPFFPPVGGAPVPEPVTMVLLGLGGLAVLARRRK